MTIKTKEGIEKVIEEKQIIQFATGLFGFESLTKYAILDAPQEPFLYLQSLEATNLSFIVINPFLFRPDYSLNIEDSLLAEIGITKPQDCLVLVVVSLPENQERVVANLMGPIVINRNNHFAMQVVLTDPRWHVRHDILSDLENQDQ